MGIVTTTIFKNEGPCANSRPENERHPGRKRTRKRLVNSKRKIDLEEGVEARIMMTTQIWRTMMREEKRNEGGDESAKRKRRNGKRKRSDNDPGRRVDPNLDPNHVTGI